MMRLNLAKTFCSCASVVLFYTTNATDRLYSLEANLVPVPPASYNCQYTADEKDQFINSHFGKIEHRTDFIVADNSFCFFLYTKLYNRIKAMSKKGMQVTKRMRLNIPKFFKVTLKRFKKRAWSSHLTKPLSITIEIKNKTKRT